MDRAKWLARLKVGDEVAIKRHALGPVEYLIGVVQHITPTRRRIDVGIPDYHQVWKLDREGYTKRTRGSYTPRNYIEPVTEEVLSTQKRRYLKRKLEGLLLDERSRLREDLTQEQMEAIIAIMSGD